MASSLPLDLLIVSTRPALDLGALEGALGVLRAGTMVVTAPEASVPAVRADRVFAGRMILRETLARVVATLEFAQHRRPVLADMPPELLTRLTRHLEPEWLAVVRNGVLSVDLHADLGDPDRAWCLRWVTRIASVVVERLGGVVFDPAAQRLFGAEAYARLVDGPLVEQITLHREPWGPETRWLHTHGLQKLGQPELDLAGVPQMLEQEATQLLRQVVEAVVTTPSLAEPVLSAGMHITCDGDVTLLARATRSDSEHVAPWGRLRLVTNPAPGTTAGEETESAVLAFALAAAREAQAHDDWAGAARRLDRILAASPEDPATLATRSEVWLRQGDPRSALEVATALTLLAPDDARGPLCAGQALATLGRLAESLAAFSRAIALAPDQSIPYALRAQVRERLGQPAEAQADRARAQSLRTD